jgi:hypothetical protein
MRLTLERGTFAEARRSAVSFVSLYWGGGLMPISDELRDEYLEFVCPSCSHVMVKKGSWFKVISKFNCDQCDARIRLGYPTKL